MSENKNYKITKTSPMSVLFMLHPVSNIQLTRKIFLTDQNPVQALPLDWALGVFQDEEIFNLYRNKCFTFDDNESIVKAAFEAGVYFDDKLDFEPAKPDRSADILKVLKSGVRSDINKIISTEGKDVVAQVAGIHVEELQQGVVNMLESVLGVQLTCPYIPGDDEDEPQK